jgi:hypothetical protein
MPMGVTMIVVTMTIVTMALVTTMTMTAMTMATVTMTSERRRRHQQCRGSNRDKEKIANH